VGLVPIERWRALLGRAGRRGALVGVDERAYPRDFAIYARYQRELERTIPGRYPLPGPPTQGQLESFLAGAAWALMVRAPHVLRSPRRGPRGRNGCRA
jgi:hypothetical protein